MTRHVDRSSNPVEGDVALLSATRARVGRPPLRVLYLERRSRRFGHEPVWLRPCERFGATDCLHVRAVLAELEARGGVG